MSYLIDHWYVVLVTVVAVVAIITDIYAFKQLSPAQQKDKVQEWLIWAVCQAESELGGGTGQLKLRKVYEMFIVAFPWLVKAISFSEFSEMVDIALEQMKEMLHTNEKVKDYIETGNKIDFNAIMSLIKSTDAESKED